MALLASVLIGLLFGLAFLAYRELQRLRASHEERFADHEFRLRAIEHAAEILGDRADMATEESDELLKRFEDFHTIEFMPLRKSMQKMAQGSMSREMADSGRKIRLN